MDMFDRDLKAIFDLPFEGIEAVFLVKNDDGTEEVMEPVKGSFDKGFKDQKLSDRYVTQSRTPVFLARTGDLKRVRARDRAVIGEVEYEVSVVMPDRYGVTKIEMVSQLATGDRDGSEPPILE